MSLELKKADNLEIINLIGQLNSSNFFSTQPNQIWTPRGSQTFRQTSNIDSKSKSQYLISQKPLESLNIQNSLQKIFLGVEQKSHLKVKHMKEKLNETKSVYLNQLQHTHRKLRNFQHLKHNTEIIKSRFIDLYETKKFKLDSDKILFKGKISNEDFMRRSFLNVKLKKTERQVSLLSARNSEQSLMQQLHQKTKLWKEQNKKQMNSTFDKEKSWRFQKLSQVVKSANKFTIRKQQREKIRKMKSHFNYQVKINEEKQIIAEYDVIQSIKQNLIKDIQRHNPELYDEGQKQQIFVRAKRVMKQNLTTGQGTPSLQFSTEPYINCTQQKQNEAVSQS